MTEKQRRAVLRRRFKRDDKNFVAMYRRITSGSRYIELRNLADLAQAGDVELPLVYRWLLRLHEASIQALRVASD